MLPWEVQANAKGRLRKDGRRCHGKCRQMQKRGLGKMADAATGSASKWRSGKADGRSCHGNLYGVLGLHLQLGYTWKSGGTWKYYGLLLIAVQMSSVVDQCFSMVVQIPGVKKRTNSVHGLSIWFVSCGQHLLCWASTRFALSVCNCLLHTLFTVCCAANMMSYGLGSSLLLPVLPHCRFLCELPFFFTQPSPAH